MRILLFLIVVDLSFEVIVWSIYAIKTKTPIDFGVGLFSAICHALGAYVVFLAMI